MALSPSSGDEEDRGVEGPGEGNGSFDAANLDLAVLSFSFWFSLSLSFSFDFLLVGLTSASSMSPGEGEGDSSSSSHIPGIEGAGGRASRGGVLEFVDCWCRGLIVTVARGGVGDAGEERPEGMLNEFRSCEKCLSRLEVCFERLTLG